MRTTVTLDEDVTQSLKQIARERGISFKQAINDAVRSGLAKSKAKPKPYRVKARDLKVRPGIDLTKANQLAAQLDDEVFVRKMKQGK